LEVVAGLYRINIMEILNTLEQSFYTALPAQWGSNFKTLLETHKHPLTRDFPLLNPFHVLLILLAYVISVPIGKAVMKNKKKFELKTFSMLHNTFLIILSSYMCIEVIRNALALNFSVFGNGVGTTEKELPLARILWIFYVSKIVEFIDTWIMILKKNDRQISFLHVYHHATIFPIWFLVLAFAPGGDSYFSAAQNSFIHVLMYTYYLCASFGIQVPYKRYLTQAQMLQFFLNFVQAIYDIVMPSQYPKFLAYILFFYMITLLALFANFYVKNMGARRTEKKTN